MLSADQPTKVRLTNGKNVTIPCHAHNGGENPPDQRPTTIVSDTELRSRMTVSRL